MAGNLSLTNSRSSNLSEPAFINNELNVIMASGLATLGSLGILSLFILVTTIIIFKNIRESSYIIILSFAFCDIGHLSVVMSHVVPELILREIHWAWGFETFFTHSNLLLWYSSLGHFCVMAINRFYGVCRPVLFCAVFSARRTWLYCACICFIAFLMCMTPFTGILCCRKIFDIHYDANEEEVKIEQWNTLKIITVVLKWLTVAVMTFCYIAAFVKLRAKTAVDNIPQNPKQFELLALKDEKRRSLTYQFSVISVVFCLLLCFQIASTELGYKRKGVITTLQFLYTLNSAVNPVIYLLFNSALRKQTLSFILRKLGRVAPGATDSQQLGAEKYCVKHEPPMNQEALHQKRLTRMSQKRSKVVPLP